MAPVLPPETRSPGVETRRLQGALEAKLFGEPAPSPTVGRFEIEGLLGQGAMGAVYRARDPALDRMVALKLLRGRAAPGTDGITTLKAEARALARLSHPNVVSVLDVGEHEGQVFIAMEFVRGQTLDQWAARVSPRAPRRLERLVGFSLDAVRGLEAAHAVDIVHRDVKPQNMLVGDDSRLRVADFGLAVDSLDPRAVTLRQSLGARGRDEVTDAPSGPVVGTPAYMSPEQFEGTASPLSDQFSLCISLWEVAFAERPFAGSTMLAVLDAVERGAIRVPATAQADARWFASVLRPGLAWRPEDRYPTLAELEAALLRGPPSTRRPWLLWSTVAATMLGTTVALSAASEEPAEACAHVADAATTVWTDRRRAALSSTPEVRATIDAHMDAWSEARVGFCEADRETQDFDATMRCLDQQLQSVDAFLAVVVDDTPSDPDGLMRVAQGWPAPDRCVDPEIRAAFRLPDDPAQVERIKALERDLLEDTARETIDPASVSRARAEDLVARARAVGHDPALALALEHHGERLTVAGDGEAAAGRFEEAYQVASRAGMAYSAVRSATSAATVYTRLVGRYEDAERMLRAAESLLPRLAEDGSKERVQVAYTWSELLSAQGRATEARPLLQAALATATAPLDEARLAEKLGSVEVRLGLYDDAERNSKRALELYRQELGPDHPQVATVLTNLGNTWLERGRATDARDVFLEALRIAALLVGKDNPNYAMLDANLGTAYALLGEREKAKAAHARALSVFDATLPASHPAQVMARVTLSHFESDADAEARLGEALSLAERHFGVESVEAALARSALGALYLRTDRPARAVAALRSSLERHETFASPRRIITDQSHLARALMQQGEISEAQRLATEALERAEELYDADATDLIGPLLAAAEVAPDRPAIARAHLERALALPHVESRSPHLVTAARSLLTSLQ